MKNKKEISGFRTTFFPLVKWGAILLLAAKPFDLGIGAYNKAKAELEEKIKVSYIDASNTRVNDVNEPRLVYSEPNEPNLLTKPSSVDSNPVDANDVNKLNIPAEPNPPKYTSKMSQKGIDFIGEFEEFKNIAYQCPAGVWTIGYGHTKGVKKGDKITEKQAKIYLREDIAEVEAAISENVTVLLTQQQYDTLGSLIFNIGADGFKESTLLKRLNDKKYDQVSEQIKRWNKAGKRVLNGLVNRRTDEIEMWKEADYTRDHFD